MNPAYYLLRWSFVYGYLTIRFMGRHWWHMAKNIDIMDNLLHNWSLITCIFSNRYKFLHQEGKDKRVVNIFKSKYWITCCMNSSTDIFFFFFWLQRGLKARREKNYIKISLGIEIPKLSAVNKWLISWGQESKKEHRSVSMLQPIFASTSAHWLLSL
jgi:hypothetical protein